jgi:hypothetical protein
MGGAASQVGVVPYMVGKTESELVNLMMPVYYLKDETVSEDDLAVAKKTWNMILDGTAPGKTIFRR